MTFKEKKIEEFKDFYWEKGQYEGRKQGIDGYLDFLSTTIDQAIESRDKEILEWCEKEVVEEGEAMYADDPDGKMSEGYTDGYNQALSDLKSYLTKK